MSTFTRIRKNVAMIIIKLKIRLKMRSMFTLMEKNVAMIIQKISNLMLMKKYKKLDH